MRCIKSNLVPSGTIDSKLLRAHKRGVVLLIDEIQFLERSQLEALIMAIHKTVQRALPITLVGTSADR
ncbi:Uncharacterised protein [Arcanobacterium haemolyticum]|nr:Uncharacterised protein [Arcanobacterium haemolyticum]